MMLLTFALISIAVVCGAEPLEERIAHSDPSSYKQLSAVHKGAGEMKFTGLLRYSDLTSNFLYLHAGVILPKGGIGHHFHHKIEEMFVILDGEAEFTINGRTSRLIGPVAVPCKMGNSHGIYNHSDKPIRWLNFAVSLKKSMRGDAFDLGDDRVGAPLDEKPVFVSTSLVLERLRDKRHRDAEAGVLYRRALRPAVFSTPWSYVDHMVVPAGAATGKRRLEDAEEVCYVMGGSGVIRIGEEEAAIKEGDAIPIRFAEELSYVNQSEGDLELLVIGIGTQDK